MSDPADLLTELKAAEDAFSHARGRPTFEPEIDSGPDAAEGAVQIQKACRLLSLAHEIDDVGEYYGAILEHAFIVIEHGDVVAVTETDDGRLEVIPPEPSDEPDYPTPEHAD
jgi:hypothetical protein